MNASRRYSLAPSRLPLAAPAFWYLRYSCLVLLPVLAALTLLFFLPA